mmetsp:Transcript_45636/g.111096  ORF Transcript_45636/g.111096 Transcript_45636/m.111096 type:complete len:404 (+) Transcript_45636:274-1485(+)
MGKKTSAMMQDPGNWWFTVAKAASICGIYMAVGPILMILNKEILDKVGFKYPLLVSSLGLVFAAAVTHTMRAMNMLELKNASKITTRFWLTKCLPVGVCHAATLAFGNAVYLFMGMSVIQFLKAFTPIITAMITYVMLGRKEKPVAMIALVLVCSGTCAAIVDFKQGLTVTTTGLVMSFFGSVSEAVRLVMTDMLLSSAGLKMDVLENVYYLAPAGALCLFVSGCVMEGPAMMAAGHLELLLLYPVHFCGAASLGLGVQLMTTTVIKVSSATTLKVLGLVRNIIPVLCGVVLYGEIITVYQAAGYSASMIAFGWYTYLKMPQNAPPPAHPPAHPPVHPDAHAESPGRQLEKGMYSHIPQLSPRTSPLWKGGMGVNGPGSHRRMSSVGEVEIGRVDSSAARHEQ